MEGSCWARRRAAGGLEGDSTRSPPGATSRRLPAPRCATSGSTRSFTRAPPAQGHDRVRVPVLRRGPGALGRDALEGLYTAWTRWLDQTCWTTGWKLAVLAAPRLTFLQRVPAAGVDSLRRPIPLGAFEPCHRASHLAEDPQLRHLPRTSTPGKTTVSERILYYTGKEHAIGEVHEGSRQDGLPRRRSRSAGSRSPRPRRRSTGRSTQLNLIDTPGHVDFTAEVERSACGCSTGRSSSSTACTAWKRSRRRSGTRRRSYRGAPPLLRQQDGPRRRGLRQVLDRHDPRASRRNPSVPLTVPVGSRQTRSAACSTSLSACVAGHLRPATRGEKVVRAPDAVGASPRTSSRSAAPS